MAIGEPVDSINSITMNCAKAPKIMTLMLNPIERQVERTFLGNISVIAAVIAS